MHRELLKLAFKKAREEEIKDTGIQPSNNKCALRLSDFIAEECKPLTYHQKSLYTPYTKALKFPEDEVVIKQPYVVKGLAVYLGYSDFEEFVSKNKAEKESEIIDRQVDSDTYAPPNENPSPKNKRRKLIFGISISLVVSIIAITAIVLFKTDYPTTMKWEGDHYVESSFSAEGIQKGDLKLYKEDRIENFKRIEADCATLFFNPDGSVKIWYGKNMDGKLQYFSDYGLHPETGKTLKPITRYMIRKYVCEGYGE